MAAERDYQSKLIKRLKKEFPGCLVVKNDSGYIQGIPDLTVFYKNNWAMLECKKSESAPKRPNQEYYIETCRRMSYASFIFPENEEEVLNEIRRSFGA